LHDFRERIKGSKRMAEDALERIQYSRPGGLPGVQVLVANDVARRWRVFHETYAVCTVLEAAGCAEVLYRGRRHDVGAGDVLLLEPGEAHANPRITPRGSFRNLFIPSAVVEEAAAGLAMSAPTHWRCAVARQPGMFRALWQLHRALEHGATALEQESRFCGALDLLLRYYGENRPAAFPPASAGRLAQCRDFILEHYAEPITLQQLAQVGATTRYQLVRAFRLAFGLAPHAFQIIVRIQKARALLSAGAPPASVAAATGFADQSHFGRHFLQATGVTPAQYARALTASGSIAVSSWRSRISAFMAS
jgi:AraC-like DNA-binding protein